jgi:hypothetical protein
MNAQSARQILLVQAIEEADAQHAILDRATRDRATADARSGANTSEEILSRRAAILCDRLNLSKFTSGFTAGKSVWIALAAILLLWLLASGIFKGLWPADKSINILIVPLLLLFVWNIIYLATRLVVAVGSLVRRGTSPPTLLERAFSSLGSNLKVSSALAERFAQAQGGDARIWYRILHQFGSKWLSLAQPLYTARFRFALHVAACVLVAGEFAYVYLKGIAVEFQATWESTWLSAEATHGLLAKLLWPAWTMLGEGLPAAAEIAQLKTNPPNAAYWVNLYLAQACIVVFIPRLLLSTLEYFRAVRLDRSLPLPLDDRYYQNLLHAERGQGVVARVVPYSFQPPTNTRDAIHDLLASDLGYSAHVEIEEPLAYGAIEGPVSDLSNDSENDHVASVRWVLLFNLAQTPEREVQGALLASFAGQSMAMLVDAQAYRERLAGEPELDTRLDSRRMAWQNLASEHGLTAVFLGIEQNQPTSIAWNT